MKSTLEISPTTLKNQSLKPFFSEFGKVDNLDWKTKEGRFRGYCYLTYTTDEEKDKAIEALGSKEIKGRQLNCHVAPPKEEKVNPPSTTLYVGNLPPEVTETEIKEKFAGLGPVVGIRLVYSSNGEFKKCAFLDFSDQETATKVFESKVLLNGNELVLNYNTPKDKRCKTYPPRKTFRGSRGGPVKAERDRGGSGSGRGSSRGGRGSSRGGRGSSRGGRGSSRGGRGGR